MVLPGTSIYRMRCSLNKSGLFYSAMQSHSLHPSDAGQGFGALPQQVFCNAKKEKRPEVVAELRKPKAKRDSSITDSYSSPSKGNEFITTFKQDIQGHKKGLDKEEKQNLKDAVKSIYSPRRLADGEAMMCEIQGAQEDFVRRWEMCFREYPDILTEPKNTDIVNIS